MIVNKYKIVLPENNQYLNIPLEMNWDFLGRDDSIDEYQEKMVKEVIGEVKNMKKPLIEALKEMGRVVAIAVLPVLISGLEKGAIDAKVLAVVGAVAGIKFVDKLLHAIGKEKSTAKKEDKLLKGLTRF